MDVKQVVKDVLVNELKVKPEELKDDVSLQESISVDSTEMVDVVLALEKAAGVKLETSEVTKYCTINEIEGIIKSKKD